MGVLLVHSLSEGDIMRISVGIDIAKEIQWVCAVDAEGRVQIDRKMANRPAEIARLVKDLRALRGCLETLPA